MGSGERKKEKGQRETLCTPMHAYAHHPPYCVPVQEEVLPELSRQLEQSLAEKPLAPKSRSASSGGAAPAAPKAPAGPSRGSMGGAAGRAGERQHALTHQGLAERHSISVPLGVAGGGSTAGPGGSRCDGCAVLIVVEGGVQATG